MRDPELKPADVPSKVIAGQAVYSPRVLASYDLLVLGLSNRWIWKCPTPRLRDFYNAHITANHLDVGVGTGYYLDRCTFPAPPRIGLVDLNPNCLAATARRIQRYEPTTYVRNVLESFDLEGERYSSIGVNYLLHCLPGDISSKSVVFDHLQTHLTPGGVIFGSTLLAGGVRRSWLARRLMATYNLKGIFSNTQDDLEGLRRALADRFTTSHVEVIGCAALFWGRK